MVEFNVDPLMREEITSFDQANEMRMIRNEGRFTFSHDTHWIEYDQQQWWWNDVHRRGVAKAWLYSLPEGYVGYGLLLRDADGFYRPSTAIYKKFAGHAYGRTIVSDLVHLAGERIIGAGRADYPPALKLHAPEFWDYMGTRKGISFFISKAIFEGAVIG